MNKKVESKTCAHSNTNVNDPFSNMRKLERHEHIYPPIQQIQASFSQEKNVQERRISCSISGSSFSELKSMFEDPDEMAKHKQALLSEIMLENQNSFTQILDGNGANTLKSFSSKGSFHDAELILSQQRDLLPKNDLPSLFVHDNYFKKHAIHSSASKAEPRRQKIQSSKSFQCFTSQSFSNAQVAHSSNGSITSQASCIQNAKFSSMFSRFHESSQISEPSLSSKVDFGSSKTSENYYEFYRQANIYKRNTESAISVCFQNFDSISESDDDDEDEEEDMVREISYLHRKPIEYTQNVSNLEDKNRSLLAIEYDMKKDKLQQTLHKIAMELLTTERTFVDILHLLDQVFAFRVDQENRVHAMFPQEIVPQMFSNLKSLYKLHHDFLLPQLEARMSHWEENRRIGDIMKNFAPFLKMYTEYVKNYDNAVKLINLWYQKNQRFQQILDELHVMEECKRLTLQHHMLTPVQRVPRYQLLLKDYLKKLPEDSPDKCDTEKALELVSIAAIHANDTMKKTDKFKKLLEIQEMITGCVDLVSPSRELLKEGKIIKISARSGDHQERYIFLFNDLLLLCSHRLLPNKVVSGPSFKVRAKLDVDNLVVEEGDNLETANTFYIHTVGRLIELYTPTSEEKTKWMEVLSGAMSILAEKRRSLRVRNNDISSQDNIELGTCAPNFVKLELITNCMGCDSPFSTFTFRRKHHCHACGIVACNKCLVNKMQLSYEGGKQGKVCKSCYDILVTGPSKREQNVDECRRSVDSPQRQKGILDVNPSDPSIVSGYLQLKARSRFWVRRWFTLHDDFVLYSFNSHMDEMALTSMPLPGYTIGMPDKSDSVDGRGNVFKLFHKKKMYFFQATDQSELERWVSALEKASRAESLS